MKDEDIEALFNSNSDCYADTWEDNHDTVPPTMVEGEVVMAMTLKAFKKVYKAASKEEVSWDEAQEKFDQVTPTFLQTPMKLMQYLVENYNLTKK